MDIAYERHQQMLSVADLPVGRRTFALRVAARAEIVQGICIGRPCPAKSPADVSVNRFLLCCKSACAAGIGECGKVRELFTLFDPCIDIHNTVLATILIVEWLVRLAGRMPGTHARYLIWH